MCLAQLRGRLVAGVGSVVQLFHVESRSAPAASDKADVESLPLALVGDSAYFGQVFCLYLAAWGDFVAVADLMRSVTLLQFNPIENTLVEAARDPGAQWMTAIAALGDSQFVGAENGSNLFALQRDSAAPTDLDRTRLFVTGEFHVGDLVNRIVPGSLVMHEVADLPPATGGAAPASLTDPAEELAAVGAKRRREHEHAHGHAASGARATDVPRPRLIFGTVSGALGVVLALPKPVFEYLVCLQGAMEVVLPSVGGLRHDTWRAWYSDRVLAETIADPEPSGFVDGDFLERFLDLDTATQEAVVARMNTAPPPLAVRTPGDAPKHADGRTAGPATVEEALRTLNDLVRLH
jgi:DNA damage-binding protein 1